MKCIVSWINFYDNVLKMKRVEAPTIREAINTVLEEALFESENLEDIQNEAFDMDMMVNVLEDNDEDS